MPAPIANRPLSALSLLCALAGAASGQCVFSFTHADYLTSAGPTACAIVDMNGDGRPDLVSAHLNAANIGVRLNNGDGAFAGTYNFFPAPAPTWALTAADFNGDGAADIVAASASDDAVYLLFGDGDGALSAPLTIPTGASPYAVAAADINDDARPDLVVGEYGGDTARVMLGNGDGTFLQPTAYPVGTQPIKVRIADLDNDGVPDLAVANYGGSISILWGAGAGSFEPAVTIPVGSAPYSLDAADLNHDGLPDLAVADYDLDKVTVLLNNSSRAFTETGSFQAGIALTDIRIAELDGDGNPDIAVTAGDSNALNILVGDGTGAFTGAKSIPMTGPWNLETADLDADDRADLVAVGPFYSRANVLRNTSGNYLPPAILEQPVGLVVDAGQPAALSVSAATASGLPISYQWRRDGLPLSDSESVSGARTPELNINPAGPADAAVYDCLVSIPACDGSTLDTVTMPAALGIRGTDCPGDFNADGTVNTLDVLAFLNAWAAGCP